MPRKETAGDANKPGHVSLLFAVNWDARWSRNFQPQMRRCLLRLTPFVLPMLAKIAEGIICPPRVPMGLNLNLMPPVPNWAVETFVAPGPLMPPQSAQSLSQGLA